MYRIQAQRMQPIVEQVRPQNGSPLLRVAAGLLTVLFLPAAFLWLVRGQWQMAATTALLGGLFGVFAFRGLNGLRKKSASNPPDPDEVATGHWE